MALRSCTPAALLALAALLLGGCGARERPPAPAAASLAPAALVDRAEHAPGAPRCPATGGHTVRSAGALRSALAAARPGDVIRLADGDYAGAFEVRASGSAHRPISLCGSRRAVLDGHDEAKYVLHLDGARWWRLVGFGVRNGRKGIVVDRGRHDVLSGLAVGGTGDEAIHLRTSSTDNLVVATTVRDTGHRRAKFGEGIYVGSAHSNWCTYTACAPDRSDRNRVVGNDIADTTSESIDVKEGTTGGVVSGNRMSGAGLTAADSWIDVKGNGWLVERNVGTDSPEDGIQTHVESAGWGERNVIRRNRLRVGGQGYGVYVHEPERTHNLVTCDNVVRDAARGLSNLPCRRARR